MAAPNQLPPTMRAAQWSPSAGSINKSLEFTSGAKLPKGASSLPKSRVLVKVAYASLNHLDYKVAEMPLGRFVVGQPYTPGLDFSGTVVSSTLSGFEPGQNVLGRMEPPQGGALAEYLVVGKPNVAALPESVSLKDASCVGISGVTALQCLKQSANTTAGNVLINGGSGGVGVFAIQVAKALGYNHVTAICSGTNAELCKSLGADEVIDYKKEDVVEVLQQTQTKYDIFFDTVFANPNLYWQCHQYLAPKGKYIDVGLPPQFKTVTTLLAIHLLPGWAGGGKRKFQFHSVTANSEHFAQVAEWIGEGKVRPVIEEEFALEDSRKAYEKLKAGRSKGKLVVKVSTE